MVFSYQMWYNYAKGGLHMQCKYCGHLNDDNNKFCGFCGQPLETNEQTITGEVISTENVSTENVIETTTFSEPEFIHTRKLSIISIIIYFVVFYVLTSVISSTIVGIFCAMRGIDTSQIDDLSVYLQQYYPRFYYNFLAGMNLFTYLSLIAVVVPLLRNCLKTDFRTSLSKKGKFWKAFGIGLAVLYGVSVASSTFINIVLMILKLIFPVFKEISSTSGNQSSINELLFSGPFPLIVILLMTIVCAPILEELIFRKSFFNLTRRKTAKMVVISGAIFGSIHTVSSLISIIASMSEIGLEVGMASIVVELLNFVSYFASGIALGAIYYKAKCNIWVTISVHSVYNAIGIIGTLLLQFLM